MWLSLFKAKHNIIQVIIYTRSLKIGVMSFSPLFLLPITEDGTEDIYKLLMDGKKEGRKEKG